MLLVTTAAKDMELYHLHTITAYISAHRKSREEMYCNPLQDIDLGIGINGFPRSGSCMLLLKALILLLCCGISPVPNQSRISCLSQLGVGVHCGCIFAHPMILCCWVHMLTILCSCFQPWFSRRICRSFRKGLFLQET